MQKPIIFVAGKSGGHIVPCITLAQEIKDQSSKTPIIFITTTSTLDIKIIKNHTMIDQHYTLKFDAIPGKKLWLFPFFFFKFLHSFFKSLWLLHKLNPDKIVSTGGLIAIPVCYAAKALRIPIELYELNVIPGKAIHLLAPLATKLFICFKNSQQYFSKQQCIFTPYPIKPVLKKEISQHDALKKLGLKTDKKTIFVLGGSQGSQFLNKLSLQCAATVNNVQIIHQTGNDRSYDWNDEYKKLNIPALVFDYQDDIEKYYAAADLIICRSGAGTLFEILYCGKKAITIPLETATTDHQKFNAQALAQEYPRQIFVLDQKEIGTTANYFGQLINQRLFMP